MGCVCFQGCSHARLLQTAETFQSPDTGALSGSTESLSMANPAFRGTALSVSYFSSSCPQTFFLSTFPLGGLPSPAGAGARLRPSCHWTLFKLKIPAPILFHCCESSLAGGALCTTSERVHYPSWCLFCPAASPRAAVTALPSCFSALFFADTSNTDPAVPWAAHSSDSCVSPDTQLV